MRIIITVLALFISTAAAQAQDALGSTKPWGSVDVTLQSYSVKAKSMRVELLLKNNSDKAENISSIMQFAVLSDEGDKAELDMNGQCDGMIPPRGLLKCKLSGKFEMAPKALVIQVGAGFEGEPVYFNVSAQ